MSALARLTTTETKLFFREPIAAFLALAFPLILLVILGAIPSFRESSPNLGGLRVIDIYVPIMVAIAVTTVAVTVLPQQFATYREKGILRRMRTTPVKPSAMLGAQLLMCTVMSIATMVGLVAVAWIIYDVSLPENLAAFFVSFLFTAVAMFALGLLIAALARNNKAASAIGMALFFPLMFCAGLWIPRDTMNNVLLLISDLTPAGAGVQALQDATAGQWPPLLALSVMLGWTIVAGGLAARYFRWELVREH